MNHVDRKLGVIAVSLVVLAGCAGSGGPPATPSPVTSLSTGPSAAASASLPVATANSSVTPSASIAPSAAPSAAAGDLQAMLDDERTSYGAPGALAVVRVGDQRWAATSGRADLAGTPLAATTRFRIASITKPIVATLVLDQVARGKLRLDDIVGTLLPGVVRAEPPITVRQLLNHTSGVFDESNDGNPITDIEKLSDPAVQAEARPLVERYLAGERVIAPDRIFVALAETHDRYFAPGTGYHYSNTNYQLAAMILEKTTGRSLADLLRAGIVQPLGLRHTTIAPPDTKSPELRGYVTSNDGSMVDITDDLTFFGNGGNGGVISTADELLAMMRAIVSGRLLPAALVTDIKTPEKESYGLGFATYTLTCGTFYGHEGGVNGTASIAIVSPDGGTGVVIALNRRTAADPGLPALADRMLCPHV